MTAVAVVCAHNEEQTVGQVVRTLVSVLGEGNVLTVDDGSSDTTKDEALQSGSLVLSLNPNRGKGNAMKEGVLFWNRERGPEAILFADADLVGLRPFHVEKMLTTYAQDVSVGQVVGMRDYGIGPLGHAQKALDLISGERVVASEVLSGVPSDCWTGYRTEVAINAAVKKARLGTATTMLWGVHPIQKEKKTGLVRGYLGNAKMYSSLLAAKRSLGKTGCCTSDRRVTYVRPILFALAGAARHMVRTTADLFLQAAEE